MTISFQQLHFSPSLSQLLIGILVLVVMAWLCGMGYRRSARSRRSAGLEVLRFLIALLVVALLWQPEWRTVIEPTTKPRIALLWDASQSMQTTDAELPAVLSPQREVVKRAEFVQKVIDAPWWKQLADDGRNEVVVRSFSTVPEDPAEQQSAGSDLSAPLEELLEKEDNLRAAIVISDGDWNQGQPPVGVAQKFSLRNIPLFTISAGSAQRLPDLDLLAVNAPTYGIVGENMQIPFSIRNSLEREVRTILRLRDEKGRERSKTIVLPANQTTYDSILWKLEGEGTSTMELSFPMSPGELVASNNARKFTIAGKPEKIRVLVVESLPRWEYRFLRNALSRDPGVELSCLLFHPQLGVGGGPDYIAAFPEKIEDLAQYDVIFLGDVGLAADQLSKEQCELIRGLVENQASGLVFMPGAQGNQLSLRESALSDLLPVAYDATKKTGIVENAPSPLALTTDGASSLLTMLGDTEEDNPQVWRGLPGFYWHAAVERAKPGTSVLAVHANRSVGAYGRVPLIVTKTSGSGKILFMGIDSAWRWRRGVEDKYHYRFWGQVARWMSYQRNMAAGQRVRLFYTPERPSPGDTVSFTANAFDRNGAPLQEGTVVLSLTSPAGQTQVLEMVKSENAWGSFTGRAQIAAPGEWKLRASIANDDAPAVEAKLLAQSESWEKTGQPARPEVLEEMARIARGRMMEPEDLPKLMQEIRALPEPRPLEMRVALWQHPLVISVLVLLATLFWIGRKWNGQI
ncbi:MAG: hypothetical protein RLZZ224_403 [Verrucomicrobiota bacterium]